MKADSLNAVSFRRDAEETPGTKRTLWPEPGAVSRDHRNAPSARLTPRQVEVLALLCEGLPNKLICRQLNIATGTVKVHISCILRELGVASRLQAVVTARRYGLLDEAAPGAPEQAATFGPANERAMAIGSLPYGAPRRVAVAA